MIQEKIELTSVSQSGWKGWLQASFTLDLRSVSLLRIFLSLILLVDLTNRLRNFEAHYLDSGVFPREAVNLIGEGDYWWSLYYFTGSGLGVGLLFALSYLTAFMLLLGKFTRPITVIAWVLWLSLHTRNDFVVDGADNMTRNFLLWAIFIPWGEAFSLDARKRRLSEGNQVLNVGSVAFILQFIIIYFFTGLWKSGPSWHADGNAIYLAVSVDIFARGFADWLSELPHWMLVAMTKMVWFTEVFAPFLVLIPWRNAQFRWLAILIFTGFQIGLALAFRLGHFPLVSIAIMAMFIPSSFWQKRGMERPSKFHWIKGNRVVRMAMAGLAIVIMAIAFFMNVVTFENSPVKWDGLKHFAERFRIDQKWSMFAPDPDNEDGWYIIPAKLADGSEVDLMAFAMVGGEPFPVTLEKPARVHSQFGSARWQAYMGAIWLLKYKDYRPYFMRYVHRKWLERHPNGPEIKELRLIYMLEMTEDWAEKDPEPVLLSEEYYP